MAKSWKVEVTTRSDNGTYASNMLRFSTKEQGERYAQNLFIRWTAVEKWRVVESDDPVTEDEKES